jgi:hypothetical protein
VTTPGDGAVDGAWQQALAAEHKAVFGYGVLGPRLATDAQITLARSSVASHEKLRDVAEALLVARAQQPVAPAADYPDLYPVPSPAAAERLAITLEQTAAAAWRHAYAVTADALLSDANGLRAQAQRALTDSAVRATRWRISSGATPATVPFPGI